MAHEADAAVALVHARATDSVLLIRRAERKEDPWSGHWSFPGGRHERGDRDLLETALRELGEECGIQLDRNGQRTEMPVSLARRRTGPYLRVAPFLFQVDREQAATLDPREAVEAVWTPLSVLRDPARHGLRSVPGVPAEARFPAIDLNVVPLWGFTYRLITDWLDLNPPGARMEEAGREAAEELLDALVSHGCALDHGWVQRDGVTAAAVRGRIPVELVWEQAARPAEHIPWFNRLEVNSDRIRVTGLAFEEYVINAVNAPGLNV